MKFSFYSALITGICALLLWQCAKSPTEVAGTAISTGNALAGVILKSDGTVSASAMVRLFESHYDPTPGNEGGIPETTYTDITGAFKFSALPQGNYNIVANDMGSIDVAAIMGLTVTHDTVSAGSHTLKKPGCLSGTAYDSLTRKGLDSAYIYVQGLPFYAQADSLADFSLPLPEGVYKLTMRKGNIMADGANARFISDSASRITEALFSVARAPERLSYADYHLTFSDEFDSTGLDWQNSTNPAGKWSTYDKHTGLRTFTSHEDQQIYMDAEYKGAGPAPLGIDPFEVSNGTLKITCDTTPQAALPYLSNYKYTSGMLSSESTFYQLYGLFEIRCRAAKGQGLRSIFSLYACDSIWPPGINLFDVYGQKPDTVINEVAMRDSLKGFWFIADGINSTAAFHTYSVEWLPDQIIFYCDSVVTHRAYRTIDVPMFMIAQLSIGAYRQSGPDLSTPIPAKMEIDYIRVFSK